MFLLAMLSTFSSALAMPPAARPGEPEGAHREGEVIVAFDGDELPDEIHLGALVLLRDEDIFGQNAAVYLLPAGARAAEVARALRGRQGVRFAEPNYLVQALSTPTDPWYAYQWNLAQIDVEDAWYYSAGSKGAIAVIDSGVSAGSLDGLTTYWGGYDYLDDDWDPADEGGHGSQVASVIGAAGYNGVGLIGAACSAPLRAYRVLEETGSGSVADVASAIGLAVWEDVRVINLSLGTYSYSSALATAVSSASASGVALVAATGNDGLATISYPAGLPGVIAVGATDYDQTRVSYSNYGSTRYGGKLDLMAPGGDLDADENGDGLDDGILGESDLAGSWGYTLAEGTSFAAPHVSAALSVLMSMGATASEAEDCLIDTALDLGSAGYDSTTGYGLVQVEDALACFLAWEALWTTGTGAIGSWTAGSSDKVLGADMDGDGARELFHYNGTSYMLQEWSGSGWTRILGGTGSFSFAPVFGDFNGDGNDELLLRNASTFYVYRLSGSSLRGVSASAPGSWSGASANKLAVGDFDGDGADEVFVSNGSSAQLLDYTSSTGKWSSTKTWSAKIGASSSWTLSGADRFVAGDLDGDGYDELFVTNDSGASLLDDSRSWTKLYATSSSSGGLGGLWSPASGDQWLIADFDGDGTDSLMALSSGSAEIMDYGAGAWSSAWREDTGILFWWSQGSGDLWLAQDVDGDDRAELQAFNGAWSHLISYLY